MKFSPADPRLQNLSDEVSRAQSLISKGEYPDGKRVFLDCLQATRDLKLSSGDVYWGLAVVSDYLSAFGDALLYCRQALETDPLSPSYRRSWAVIGRRIREELLTGSPRDQRIPELHKLAVEAGVADDQVHLRFARHLLEQGKLDHARAFLEALTALSPSCSEAWVLLADLGLKTGDEALSERCALAIGSCSPSSEPWRLQQPASA
jgi:hypothetical protein